MVAHLKMFACLAILAQGLRRSKEDRLDREASVEGSGACADPVAAIKETMTCIQNKDSACATRGYNWAHFDKIHNAVNVGDQQRWPFDPNFWQNALKFSTFEFWENHAQNIGENRASVRYIENIDVGGGIVRQFEHALVTVDDDCKITRWDQYGDDAEQAEFDDALDAFLADERIKRALNDKSVALVEEKSTAHVEESEASAALVEEDESEASAACADPLAAIKATMTCIETKDSPCATRGYNWVRFNKYHNQVNAGVQLWPFDVYWQYALKFSTFQLIYDHAQNIGTNKAEVRYVEVVDMTDGHEFDIAPNNEYPFNHTVYQHEHALVTVDNNCKITRWDQYGDDAEQAGVDDALAVLLADERIKCALNIPFAKCD